MKNLHRTLVLGCSLVALAGCGADEIVSPGTSGDIIINNPAPTPSPTPTPTPTASVTPAAGCPTIAATGGLADAGTISGPTGTWRVCELPALIDADTSLPRIAGLLYALPGQVDVGNDRGPTSTGTDVTLTIAPGVIVYGGTGRSFLVVNRGNSIEASGTASQPIIFTSRDNVLGLATDASISQWGGVVLLGRAPVSDCRTGIYNNNGQKSDGSGPFVQSECEQELEGTNLTTLFGGTNSADDSGSLEFVQIRFSGFSIAPGSELQSLTTGGIGSGTTLSNIMSFNSSDDGMEFFGGSVNMKNVAIVGADDDSIDVDSGAQANMQFVVAAQRSGGGDNIIELDSPDSDFSTAALPRTTLQVANFTFLERSTANSQALRYRGGAKAVLANGVIDTDNETGARIDEAVTLAAGPTFQSVVGDFDPATPFRGSSGVTDAEVLAAWNAGSNNNASVVITLTMSIANGTNETGVAAFDVTSLSSFFQSAGYIGAVQNEADTRFREWTCNSATLNFGSPLGACTSLPVF
ncbi:MAG: hypothetical protein APF82_08790 [Sphingomonadales bacterium BRH_c42]|nr:MAG: hypothetical protein APF82_08790 [Sphingomonadales bacterium BRH_c42]